LIKISVVTVALNAAETLGATLSSVAGQDWTNVEHWLIDGGSSDGTKDVVRLRGRHLAGFISEPDRGLYDALNKGIARCTGDVIGFLNADDLYASPRVLSLVAGAFETAGIGAVYGDLQYVGRDDTSDVIRYWRAGEFKRGKLAWGWMPPHPTLYARREIYQRIGGFDTSYRIAADYDFILRLFSDPNLRVQYIPEVLVMMRAGGVSNRSLSNLLRKSSEDLRALGRNRIGGLGALVWKNLSKVGDFVERPTTSNDRL
jgi:glycosyltransferase